MDTPTAMSLTITQQVQDQRPVLVLSGELDAATAPHFADAALAIVDQGARDVIIETSGLTLCDSTGLSVFVQVAGRLRAQAGRLALVAPSEPVRRALEAGGLSHAFVVAPTVAGAIYAIFRDHP